MEASVGPLQFLWPRPPIRTIPWLSRGERTAGTVSEDVLRLVVEGLTDQAVVTLDPHGVITFWNAGAEQLFGWRSEQAVRVHVSSLLGPGGSDAGIGTTDLEEVQRQGSVTAHTADEPSGRQRQKRQNDDSRASKHDGSARVTVSRRNCLWHRFPHTLAWQSTPPPTRRRRQRRTASCLNRGPFWPRRSPTGRRPKHPERGCSGGSSSPRRTSGVDSPRTSTMASVNVLTALRLTLEALDGDRSAQPAGVAAPWRCWHASIRTSTSLPGSSDLRRWTNLGWPACSKPMSKSGPATPASRPLFHARPGNLQRYAPEVEASIYRITQEALNNVAKHARARSVNVLLELRDENLALVIEDDGVGFQATAKGETMIGLTGMRERALAVGGTVELEPTPGGGTTLFWRAFRRVAAPRAFAERPATSARSRTRISHTLTGAKSIEASGSALTAIRTRLQELQRAVGARDEFIATVAHELRNPIAPLTFQVRLALNKAEQLAAAGTPVSVEWIQTQLRGVEQRLHRLLETLDRLLDVSRLSTGRIDLQAEPMDLAEVVREVIDGFDAELAVARCKLTLSARGTATGSWDRLRVEQVCRNLLSNAIRFGAGRPIEVAVDADHDFASVYDSRPWHRHCAGSAGEDLRALRAGSRAAQWRFRHRPVDRAEHLRRDGRRGVG